MRESLRTNKDAQSKAAAALKVALSHLEEEGIGDFVGEHIAALRSKATRLHATTDNGIDQREADKFVREILFLPTTERREAIREAIDGMIETDFALLWNFVATISSMNFFEMVVEERFREQSSRNPRLRRADTLLEESDWLLPLEIDHDFFHTTIQYAQEHLPNKNRKSDNPDEPPENAEKRREFHKYLFKKAEEHTQADGSDDREHLSLNAAAIPEMFPKIREYERSVTAFLESGGINQMRNFHSITQVFKKLAQDIYGDRMEAFYTRGTTSAFEGLILRVLNHYRNVSLIATDHEYSSLWRRLTEEKVHVVNIPGGIHGTEEDIVAAMLAKGEKVLAERKELQSVINDIRTGLGNDVRLPILERTIGGLDDTNQPIILLISSVPRMGGRKFDMAKVEQLVDEANAKNGAEIYHLWVDASQDSRFITNGKVIFRSKKDSSTGGGQAIIDTTTYPPEKGDIPEALRTRGGYNASYIPQLIGTTVAAKTHTGHTYGDLLQSGSLWHLKGRGTFLGREIYAAQEILTTDEVLKGLFTLESSLPPLKPGKDHYDDNDHNQWRIDTLIRFCPTDKALELLDMRRFKEDLRRQRANFSDFDLSQREMATTESLGHNALMELLDATPFDLESFIFEVERFEQWYQSWIGRSLLPSEKRDDPNYVRTYFKEAVRDHNYLRILMTAIKKPGHLRRFLMKVKRAVNMQLQAQPKPTP